MIIPRKIQNLIHQTNFLKHLILLMSDRRCSIQHLLYFNNSKRHITSWYTQVIQFDLIHNEVLRTYFLSIIFLYYRFIL